MQTRHVGKRYLAILTGELAADTTVDQPLGPDHDSPVHVKDHVRADGKAAVSHFRPLVARRDFTVAEIDLATGRKHQIRAHAQWLGHSVVGDKIYGPDANLFLKFIDDGWNDELARQLLLPRQALHCASIDLRPAGLDFVFTAPWPEDLAAFMRERMGLAEPPGA